MMFPFYIYMVLNSGKEGHESPRWVRALGKGDGRTNRDLCVPPPTNTVFLVEFVRFLTFLDVQKKKHHQRMTLKVLLVVAQASSRREETGVCCRFSESKLQKTTVLDKLSFVQTGEACIR